MRKAFKIVFHSGRYFKDNFSQFLIVSTTAIGDTLMNTPAIRALREGFPKSQIDVLVHSKRRELFLGNPHVDRILSYRNNFFSRGLLFLKTFRIYYDYVLVLQANDDVWQILRAIRYGKCLNRQGFVNSARRVFSLRLSAAHTVRKRLAVVEEVGGKKSCDCHYDYTVLPAYMRWASEKLQRRGVYPGHGIVGMQLGAADSFKCWPVDFFVAVARYVRSQYGVKIYLNAAKKEEHLVTEFCRLLGDNNDVVHFSRISLSQSAALIKSCSLFISNDTGPMHMAIGLGIPVIGLFCPTNSGITGPLDYPRGIVIQKEIPCRPCRVRDCSDNFCMKQISVEEVCRAVDEQLSRIGAGRKKESYENRNV